MGAWGYKAFDNDEACDLRDSIIQDISRKSLKEIEKSMGMVNDVGWENEARAGANLMASVASLGCDKRTLKRKLKESEKVLQSLLENDEYIETWSDTKEIKKELRKELRHVKKLLKNY